MGCPKSHSMFAADCKIVKCFKSEQGINREFPSNPNEKLRKPTPETY